jgi:hypothetical protein
MGIGKLHGKSGWTKGGKILASGAKPMPRKSGFAGLSLFLSSPYWAKG